MSHGSLPDGPITPLSPGGPARSALPGRGGLGSLVVLAFAAGSLVAFIWWEIVADTQEEAMRTVLSSTVTCVTYRPTQTVVALLTAGFGCGALAAVASYAVRRRLGDRRHRSWAGVAAIACVILLVVQALTFLVQYAPDSSQQSGGEFSATYCSGG